MIGPTPSERQMIPRWRSSTVGVLAGETDPVRSHLGRPWFNDTSELDASLSAWRIRPSRSRAVELISAALLYRRPEVGKEAAHLILEDTAVGVLPQTLASQLLAELKPDDHVNSVSLDLTVSSMAARQTIRQLRTALRCNPRNPLGWADLAHAHVSLGNVDKADRCMRIALSFSPTNRMLLRSASRLYIHRGEPDRAHHLLAQSDGVHNDPWLLAAELATASVAKRRSRLTRHAKQLVRDRSIRPFHITELAGALATLEMAAGKDRRARQLFRLSLADPTDNSVAQAEWASYRYTGLDAPYIHLDIRYGYEARARHAFSRGEWPQAVSESRNWLLDQPFSTEPAVFGSYAASVGDFDFRAAASIAKQGLQANPTDVILRNNLVFSLVHLDQIDEAETQFRRIMWPHNRRLQMTRLATSGLLCYRRGKPEEGRKLYESALEIGRSIGDKKSLSIASTFLAYEEAVIQASTARDTMRDAFGTVGNRDSIPELARWLARLEELCTQLP